MNIHRTGVVFAVLGIFSLTGCASAGAPGAATPTPTPTAACPDSGTEKSDIPGCAVFDGEKAREQNYAYRVRSTPKPKDQAILDTQLASTEAALTVIANQHPSADQVEATLQADGLTFVEASGSEATGVAFWAEKGMAGCLFGQIAPSGELQIESGGFVADGGCHAISGH